MSIARSAELLREALPWMSRQAAGLHPVSYAVWFDYVAQTNPPLRAAIDEYLAKEGALDEFATQALFTRHVADVDPETAQRVVDHMQRVLGGIGESVGAASAHAGRYSASLAQLAGALVRGDSAAGVDGVSGLTRGGMAPRKLADVVAEVIADTGTMRSQIDGLQQRLGDSRREIERLREEVRRSREAAMLDSLTGLSNRRAFDQALANCLGMPVSAPAAGARAASAAIEAARAQAASRPPAASAASDRGPWVLMSDIDHFRRINDAYGRGFGDKVLKAVAEAMQGLVPAGATLARVGGVAFALLVPELDAAEALALAERVRTHIGSARIRRPDQQEAQRVTLSIGLAAGRDGDSPEALVARAEAALSEARDAGEDRIVNAG
jgi:diguanylate cyclase